VSLTLEGRERRGRGEDRGDDGKVKRKEKEGRDERGSEEELGKGDEAPLN